MSELATLVQPGILASVPPLARYLTFVLTDAAHARSALDRALSEIDGERCVLGLSESLIEALDANVPGMSTCPALAAPGIEAPSSVGALWCWIRGEDRGEIVLRGLRIAARLAPTFELISAIDAFKYDVGRDLTGYEDGTENPQGDDALNAAVVQHRGRGLDGSSFVAVQQWVHEMRRFEVLSPEQRDLSVGRRRSDNEEIEDAPESAHVKRTAQESFSPEAFVLRRSMPWANEKQMGLVFAAFGKSFDAFEAQLRRMLGHEDGITDALFAFTRPITGHYFWCPPMRAGALDLSALGWP